MAGNLKKHLPDFPQQTVNSIDWPWQFFFFVYLTLFVYSVSRVALQLDNREEWSDKISAKYQVYALIYAIFYVLFTSGRMTATFILIEKLERESKGGTL